MKRLLILMIALFALTACDALNNAAAEPTLAPTIEATAAKDSGMSSETDMPEEDMSAESADTDMSDTVMAVKPEAPPAGPCSVRPSG